MFDLLSMVFFALFGLTVSGKSDAVECFVCEDSDNCRQESNIIAAPNGDFCCFGIDYKGRALVRDVAERWIFFKTYHAA